MPEQRRYFITNIHRHFRRPDLIYAELHDRTYPLGQQLVIAATIDYVLDAAYERFPGEVEGVGRYVTQYGKPTQQAEAQAASVVVQDKS